MIFVFRIISPEAEDFVRDFETGAKNSFLVLHSAIQESLDYDPSQLASFFTCDDEWNRLEEITLVDMHESTENSTQVMENVFLDDKMNQKGDKLQYLHDYFSDRAFFIEIIEADPLGDDHAPPFLVRNQGAPPPQILLDLPVQEPEEFDPDDFDLDIDEEEDYFDPEDLDQL